MLMNLLHTFSSLVRCLHVFSALTLKPRLHDTTGCHTGCQTGLTTALNGHPLLMCR